MKLKRLLSHGYFPKELPPPFTTEIVADKSRYLITKWNNLLANERLPKGKESGKQAKKRFLKDYTEKYGSSSLIEYSIPKGLYSRRKIEIPNPKQFLDLSKSIVSNWSELKKFYEISEYSESSPVINNAKRAIRTKSKSWNNFKFKLIEKSFNKKIELRLDILQFYPTIYTHSIPWSILGKKDAKKYFNLKHSRRAYFDTLILTDPKAKLYKIADQIDTLVRNCNERQSIGLPIGPDTSFLLAELIGCRIDYEIKKSLKDIPHECLRYYDDYYIYLDSIADSENVLKKVQKIIYDFQLETNEHKVGIKQLPFKYIEEWSIVLSDFKFKNADKYELRNYFGLLFSLVEKYKDKTAWIINYGLLRFEYGNVKVQRQNWELLLTFLLQILLIDASNIDQVFKIIKSYEYFLNKKRKGKIYSVLEKVINEHSLLNHSFEVSWSLWFFKSFKIKSSSNVLNMVLKSNDNISKIICLDIIDSKLFTGRKPALSQIVASSDSNSLFNQNWLLIYESFIKNWLNFKGKSILSDNIFFEYLDYYGVSFYNTEKEIKTEFTMTPPPTVLPDEYLEWLFPEDSDEDDDDDEKDEAKGKY